MKRKIAFVLFLVLFLPVAVIPAAGSDKTDAAIAAAGAWLSLVDGGDYQQSWQTASAYFKGAVQSAQWVQTMQAGRAPMGKVLSRKVATTAYRTSLPGAPDGEYVVIQYTTVFENKQTAVETVTPMLDKDGQWRVSGYYIK